MSSLYGLLKISRPRFWIYLFGPYLIGLAAAGFPLHQEILLPIIIWGIFFLFPANLLVYGINDIFDYETDRLNPKKNSYETLLAPAQHRSLLIAIAAFFFPFLLFSFQLSFAALAALAAFAALSIFYSAPPIRAKTKPILDSAFNALYICPALVGYFIAGGTGLMWQPVLAGVLWAMAMHAFSAVPDINADRQAKLSTVATFLGLRATLIACTLFYTTAAILAKPYLGFSSLVFGSIYITLMVITFQKYKTPEQVLKPYRVFPVLNAIVGALIFFIVLLRQ